MSEQLAAVYEGQDVFVCLPTGYGKSLCYQTLPFLMEHELGGNKAILVLACSEDKVYRLKKHGVRASILSSSTSWPRATSLQLSALAEKIYLFFAL